MTDQKIPVQQVAFIARAIAILATALPDIATACLALVEAEFTKLLVGMSFIELLSQDSL